MGRERIQDRHAVRHFKGGLYVVLSTHAYWHEDKEQKERLVVYKSFATGKVCIRPYDEFCSEVDKEKYPNATQKYRFEQTNI